MIHQLCGSGGPGRGERAGELERGPKHFGAGGLGRSLGFGGPCRFSLLEWPAALLAALGWRGGMVSTALGLLGPHSLALLHQAPWEVPLGAQPRVKVSPQEAGRPDLLAV